MKNSLAILSVSFLLCLEANAQNKITPDECLTPSTRILSDGKLPTDPNLREEYYEKSRALQKEHSYSVKMGDGISRFSAVYLGGGIFLVNSHSAVDIIKQSDELENFVKGEVIELENSKSDPRSLYINDPYSDYSEPYTKIWPDKVYISRPKVTGNKNFQNAYTSSQSYVLPDIALISIDPDLEFLRSFSQVALPSRDQIRELETDELIAVTRVAGEDPSFELSAVSVDYTSPELLNYSDIWGDCDSGDNSQFKSNLPASENQTLFKNYFLPAFSGSPVVYNVSTEFPVLYGVVQGEVTSTFTWSSEEDQYRDVSKYTGIETYMLDGQFVAKIYGGVFESILPHVNWIQNFKELDLDF